MKRGGARAGVKAVPGEPFLAVVGGGGRRGPRDPSVWWLMGVARHKLADHWRRRPRDRRLLDDLSGGPVSEEPWDARVAVMDATSVLSRLGEHHRLALTLRYVDGLSVPEVAELLERTVHATEAL